MRLERKLVAGGIVLLLAGAAAGGGIAASSHGGPAPVRELHVGSTSSAAFLRATATYLGTDVASLRREVKAGRTLADVADATPGRSAKELARLLVAAATARLRVVSDRALSTGQERSLRAWLGRRIEGFLDDTCPLGLAGLGKHLGGCPGMKM